MNRAGANQRQIGAVSVAHVAPALPPGIVFKGVRLSRDDTTLLQMARVTLAPHYLALAKGVRELRFNGDLDGGSASGAIRAFGSDLPEIRIRFAEVDLAQLGIIRAAASARKVTGRVTGQCRIAAQPDASVSIAVEITGADATVGLLMPIGGIRSMPFDSLNVTARMTGKTVAVSSCEWKGALLTGSLSGKIGLREPAGDSTIALSGEVMPQQGLFRELGEPLASRLFPRHRRRKNGFRVTITGTVGKPAFDIK